MEFLETNQLAILRWLHIIAMVYWLGGEWGVFQTSYKVINPALSQDERMRHMDTAFRIDILARLGIISLLPLGLHMGHLWGVQPAGGGWLVLMWILWAAWAALTLGAFSFRGTKRGDILSDIEDWTRYIIIPTLIITAITSLLGYGPFAAGQGQKWFSAKILTFGVMLCLGFVLRIVMHEWRRLIPALAAGPDAQAEAKLKKSIRLARTVAYFYWIGIMTTAFFGAVKPF
jgi:uncharacterized membrane protein